jgi:hypothetical protein
LAKPKRKRKDELGSKENVTRGNRSKGRNARGRKPRGRRGGRKPPTRGGGSWYVTAPIGEFAHLQDAGTYQTLDGSTEHYIICDNTVDTAAQVAVISGAIFEKVLRAIGYQGNFDKWNATQFENMADLICHQIKFICEMRSHYFEISRNPAVTRNDGSAGVPFTRTSLLGILADLPLLPPVPLFALPICDILTTPIRLTGGRFRTSDWEVDIQMVRRRNTLAEMITLMNTMLTESDGLVYKNQASFPVTPITPELLKSPMPQAFGVT